MLMMIMMMMMMMHHFGPDSDFSTYLPKLTFVEAARALGEKSGLSTRMNFGR